MWTLSMFFFEIRYSFSLGLLLYLWYGIGLIDLYLHYMITKELRKVVRLPVEIDSVTCSLSGVAVVKGIHILSPPIEEDARWELSLIATVDEVRVMFPFLVSLLFFLLSNGELAIADDVAVQGIRFYVEGYRPPASNSIDSVISNPHAATSSDSRLGHDHAQGSVGHTAPATTSTSQHAEEVVYNVFLIGAYEKQHQKKARRGSTRRSRSRSHSHPTRLSEENRRSDVAEEESRDSLTRSSDGEGEGEGNDGVDVHEKRRCEQVVFDYGMRSLQLRENYFPTITPNHRKEESKEVQTLLTAMSSDEHHYAASMSSSSSLSATSSISSLPVATPIPAHAPLSPSKQPTGPLTSTSYATLPPHPRQSFSGFFHDTASHWKHRLLEKATHIKNKVKELHDEVQESGGIYNATKQRIAHVYEKTKQSIDVTIADKINQLHVYLCGYEPLPTARMPRLICYHVAFRQLEIHLLRALPLQLRHLESKPLLVERLDFYDVGFDNLAHIPLPKPKTSENPTTQPQSHPHSPPSKPNDSSQSSADVAESSKSLHHLNHLLARMNIPSNNHNSGDASKRPSLRSVSIRYTPETEVNEVAVEEEDHLLHLLDLFSIDIWRSGMDAMIFKYHFERKILHKLFKSNAGRVINDFFTISNWLHKPQHSLNPEESDVSGVGIADTDHHPHHSHHHSPHHPPLHRTSFSERYTTNHQSQSSATVERSISSSGTVGRRIPSRDSSNTLFVSTSRRMVTHPML